MTMVDFTARWCAPYRVLGPVLTGLAAEYAGRARFVAADVHDEPALAERFGMRAMPTLLGWRDGRVVGRRPRTFVVGCSIARSPGRSRSRAGIDALVAAAHARTELLAREHGDELQLVLTRYADAPPAAAARGV